MAELREFGEKNGEVWKKEVAGFDMVPLDSLDQLETNGIKVHCINSSEFVVGKQTNFNGPVTIINCANAFPETIKSSDTKENIVIKEKVLSESATAELQQMAQKKGTNQKSVFWEKIKQKSKEKPWKNMLIIPVSIILFLLVCTTIALTFTSIHSQEEEGKENESSEFKMCIQMPKLSRATCIYAYDKPEDCKTLKTLPLDLPVSHIVISQYGKELCFEKNKCLEIFNHYECEEAEAKCSFLVTSEGHIFEDRGWNFTTNLTSPPATKTLVICLIGHYAASEYPTYPQIESVKALIDFGVKKGFVADNYVLFPGSETSYKDSMDALQKIIKKWDNFEENGCKPTMKKQPIIFTKKDWGGLPPSSSIEMKLPVPYVRISHTVTPQCYNLSNCARLIKNMQDYHMSGNYADISYNFLVDSSGNSYEGRGWDKRSASGSFINGRNIDIAFIGDFSKKIKPTKEQFEGVQLLIEFGVQCGKLQDNYALISANATFNTLSPGKQVYEVIKNWPHFDPTPVEHVKDFFY